MEEPTGCAQKAEHQNKMEQDPFLLHGPESAPINNPECSGRELTPGGCGYIGLVLKHVVCRPFL